MISKRPVYVGTKVSLWLNYVRRNWGVFPGWLLDHPGINRILKREFLAKKGKHPLVEWST